MTQLRKSFYEAYVRGALYSRNLNHYLPVDFSKPTIIMLYPKNFTPICTSELLEAKERYAEIQACGVQFYAGSTDSPESHQRFYGEIGDMPYPILHIRPMKSFRKYINADGYCSRTTLFIKDWNVLGTHSKYANKRRSLDETLGMAEVLISRIRV